MKRLIGIGVCLALLAGGSTATAQSVKVKDGKIHLTTKDGKTVTMDKDGGIEKGDGSTAKVNGGSDDGTLNLKKKSDAKPGQRTRGEAVSCKGNNDIAVEDKEIGGVDIGVTMKGACDGLVLNSHITAKTGIELVGSGDLEIENSVIKGKAIAINSSGSGDVILDGVTLEGPIALQITGSGKVTVKNSKILGRISVTGTGDFVDGGGNTLPK